jgi:hypothetical protein
MRQRLRQAVRARFEGADIKRAKRHVLPQDLFLAFTMCHRRRPDAVEPSKRGLCRATAHAATVSLRTHSELSTFVTGREGGRETADDPRLCLAGAGTQLTLDPARQPDAVD